LRTGFGYPSADHEWEMLERRLHRRADDVELNEVIDRATLLGMQRAIEDVHVDESVGRYVVDLVAATRESPSVAVGSSPRGSLALVKLARGRAALVGRDFVSPDDVKSVAIPALAHRLVLRPELWVQRRSGEDVVREILDEVPTPATETVDRS
jgi:MoxR-like ATPase